MEDQINLKYNQHLCFERQRPGLFERRRTGARLIAENTLNVQVHGKLETHSEVDTRSKLSVSKSDFSSEMVWVGSSDRSVNIKLGDDSQNIFSQSVSSTAPQLPIWKMTQCLLSTWTENPIVAASCTKLFHENHVCVSVSGEKHNKNKTISPTEQILWRVVCYDLIPHLLNRSRRIRGGKYPKCFREGSEQHSARRETRAHSQRPHSSSQRNG